MKKNLLVLYIFILVFQQSSYAANHYKENVYQTKWCDEMCGIKEYRLVDKTRIDCLTKTHAIEFDFAYKVYESIGQALYYSIQTQKKPGVVLIVEKPEKDKKYINRLKQIASKNGIDCWLMYESDLTEFQVRPVQ